RSTSPPGQPAVTGNLRDGARFANPAASQRAIELMRPGMVEGRLLRASIDRWKIGRDAGPVVRIKLPCPQWAGAGREWSAQGGDNAYREPVFALFEERSLEQRASHRAEASAEAERCLGNSGPAPAPAAST